MKKLKSNLQNMVLVLVSVALICGGTLAYFNQLTKPAIDEQAEKALADGIKNVLDADDITVNNKSEKKRVVNGKEQTFVVYNTDKGVAIQSTDPNAFSVNLTILVGFDTEGTIKGYTLLAHAETPGLGAKAADWFQKGQPGSIVGLNPAETNLTVKNDGGEVSAITASTITSRAFLRAVQQAYLTFMEEKGK
jgi:electron transport complex protein RnfG